ncbi:MAG: WYL domain-containing protein, partial [Lachnospiraceae bacterium]|nr:WYL domain-containing protein [Lachnospiraceae bacterium]
RIVFEFNGPSVQAVLDRIPTAKVIDRQEGRHIIEASVFGDGIKMFLLSQGSWVKVISPPDFREEMKKEIEKMLNIYS